MADIQREAAPLTPPNQQQKEPVVMVSGLIKQFGKLRAVDNLDMNIYAGETFGLIGPNGSGKTTFIRILMGLVRPTSGKITIFGERVGSPKVTPHLGYMTQVNALYLDLSARENNEFQVIQFIPLVFGVQVFLSGIFWPIAQLPQVLQPVSYILPLTYANDALRSVMLKGSGPGEITTQLTALLIFALAKILLSTLTMRREVA